jgi:hypothetical protein
MGKLTKHAEVLTQLHSLVKKQAEEAQKNISGTPGAETKPESIKAEHETTDKNSVGPDNNPQGYHQKPSEDPSAPVAKTAETLGTEILNLIRKHAEAQDTVSGEPGKDTNPEAISEKNETVNKNEAKPESNTPQTTGEQKPSSDKSEPVAKAAEETKEEEKKEEKDEEIADLANKVASYELGRQFCAALLKSAAAAPSEAELMKEAGRRDLDLLIAQAAQELDSESGDEKQAEEAGAAYFEQILKEAALNEAINENEALKVKVAELSTVVNETLSKEAQEKKAAEEAAAQIKLAESVAAIVLEKLKAEAGKE